MWEWVKSLKKEADVSRGSLRINSGGGRPPGPRPPDALPQGIQASAVLKPSLPKDLQLFVTLWPSFPHFDRFANDDRLVGVRLNSAMVTTEEVENELNRAKTVNGKVPLYFDVKSRQMRIEDIHMNPRYLDMTLNHPIDVECPTPVLFKAGEDVAILDHLEEGGKRLIFQGGPRYSIKAGESICIRHKSLRVKGCLFTDAEKTKIETVKAAGFKRYFLSYVEGQRDVDEFLELVGNDAEVQLKIESEKGLEYVANTYKKRDNLFLVAARGDLYVEIERPHDIMAAMRLIISKDAEACAASRLMLSVIGGEVPSCADFSELAWLYDIGYRRMMLCDEICLKENLLGTAVRAIDEFRLAYCK